MANRPANPGSFKTGTTKMEQTWVLSVDPGKLGLKFVKGDVNIPAEKYGIPLSFFTVSRGNGMAVAIILTDPCLKQKLSTLTNTKYNCVTDVNHFSA